MLRRDEKDCYKEIAWEKVYFLSMNKHMKPKAKAAAAKKNIIKSNLDADSMIFVPSQPISSSTITQHIKSYLFFPKKIILYNF